MNELGFSDKFNAAKELAQIVNGLAVTCPEEYAAVGAQVALIRDLEKELEAEYKAHPTVVAARELQKLKGELSELLEAARKSAKGLMMAWEDAQEAKRRAEEARLQAEAQKRADDEALAAAEAAQASGHHEEAAAIIEAPVIAPVVVIPRAAQKIAGHVRRMVPKFRIVNANAIPRQYLSPDEKKIGGVVRSLKAAHGIPGVEFYEEAA